jgi:hypothetical protein
MTDDLREELARALCLANGSDPDDYTHGGAPLWNCWLDDANAVITFFRAYLAREKVILDATDVIDYEMSSGFVAVDDATAQDDKRRVARAALASILPPK